MTWTPESEIARERNAGDSPALTNGHQSGKSNGNSVEVEHEHESATTASASAKADHAAAMPEPYHPANTIRIVTAASLFDGHDAAINVMRRILQASGAEVIHLGHNRSVQEVVDAAVQEDAHAIAISSYQGGHMEYFKYAFDMLQERGAGHVKLFGGGGGTIIPEEKRELEAYGIARIYHPEDGRRMGLQGMIDDILRRCDAPIVEIGQDVDVGTVTREDDRGLARLISIAEAAADENADDTAQARWERVAEHIAPRAEASHTPVVGITGTGGAGKSSFTDEMVRRFGEDFPEIRLAVLSVDPTKRKSGGALLGDRIRMNALDGERVFMRSFATRGSGSEVSEALDEAVALCKSLSYDLILVETSGIGQADASITDLADISMYVMTPEFGAQTQLEKIEMIDLAEMVVVNKYDKPGGADALRDVRKAYQRSHTRFSEPPEAMPVYATISSQFNDRGCNQVYVALLDRLGELGRRSEGATKSDIDSRSESDRRSAGGTRSEGYLKSDSEPRSEGEPRLESEPISDIDTHSGSDRSFGSGPDWSAGRFTSAREIGEPVRAPIIPPKRVGYLLDISETVRAHKARAESQSRIAAELWALRTSVNHFVGGPSASDEPEAALKPFGADAIAAAPAHVGPLMDAFDTLREQLAPESAQLIAEWPAIRDRYSADSNTYTVRGRELTVENYRTSLSHQKIPRVALPTFTDWANILRWRLLENLPGMYPFTAGVFPYKRAGEDPTRMFAGEGGPWRTNHRFHLLSRHADAKRLSTAFDSVTLYGEDPDERPDIWGKVGNSGVSIATVEDMEALYSGFDLVDPTTSVSMTINGPAPTILAFFFNAAVRQQLRRHLKAAGRISLSDAECLQPGGGGHSYRELRSMIDDESYARLVDDTVANVRGTVQADILKEDQGQNTCIFSTEFSLKLMGDVQQWFIDHSVRNFYSVSISGYHIAEAGANPISQLAFTLSNGFTFVEYYLSRGMEIDDFAPNLSFFFSNGMDPEYAVIGRVARRIWATAMRDRYGADTRSQQLKYHVQTSGRSLHAQEIAFNDIRTTLQALLAVYDNCNSLHTNAYDEAITTPTEESVRRALAIQLIINREFGVAKNENPNQGAFIIDALTELVEEAVLTEFEHLNERGGVLGAMERMYQRGRIQDESLHYEHLKHSGELPLIGVNTFLPDGDGQGDGRGQGQGAGEGADEMSTTIELIRSTDEEKQDQLDRLRDFHARHAEGQEAAVTRLKAAALAGENLFGELMHAVEMLSLGQISRALYEVGGKYRRNM